MKFNLNQTTDILERTPGVIHALLYNAGDHWTQGNEGAETWSPHNVLGHLIHCDGYNWLPRIRLILSDRAIKKFEAFDRFAHLENDKSKNINQLLYDFAAIRIRSLAELKALNISDEHLQRTAMHPDLGKITLAELIATWLVHDLDHLSQISRVMAKQYTAEVGPWKRYMRILNPNL